MRRLAVVSLWILAILSPSALGAQATSAAQNPTIQFTTPGAKQVSVTVCNALGCNSVTHTVTVLDPRPVIDSATAQASCPASALVKLSGTGHGMPLLAYTWRILGGPSEVDVPGGASWWDTTGAAPGFYTASLHLQNTAGVADSAPVTVQVMRAVGTGFYTIPPCRLYDSRTAGAPLASSPVTLAVAGISAPTCGIPTAARAVSANVTVVNPTAAGFVTLYPGNYPQPNASVINFKSGQVRANNAILGLASDGSGTVAVRASVANAGTVDVVVDLNGYFL
ncbi:MAG TPA: hypothetical protein VOA87_00650 [Thermoanaerobaculia bacterium]|nr:hypothetical protein [Thermoanaerobaculia bacterium]